MGSKRTIQRIWLVEYFVLMVAQLSHCFMSEYRSLFLESLIISVVFYLPSLVFYIMKDRVKEEVEQIINSLCASVYIFVISLLFHTFSLLPEFVLVCAIFSSPIFESMAVKHQWISLSLELIVGGYISSNFPDWLPGSSVGLYIRQCCITEVSMIILFFVSVGIAGYKKQMEQKTQDAIEANRSKSTFLANMSHEIRTPMNAILGMSELLILDDSGTNNKEYVTTIHNSAKSLLNIINDILDFSKIDAGKMELLLERYDLESTIQDVENIIETRLKDKSVAFVIELDPDLPSVLYGDTVRIKQILINILGNAVKFTNKGYIRLTVSQKKISDTKTRLRFVIEDTGAGIPKEEMDNIFGVFTQADAKRNRNMEGTGLGLAICKRLAEAMNGDVQLESEYGKGTKITVNIEQTIINPEPLVCLENPENYNVLVCEPNRYYMESLLRICENLNVEAHSIRDINKLKNAIKKDAKNYVLYNYSQRHEDVMYSGVKGDNVRFVAMINMFETVKDEDRFCNTMTRPLGISKVAAALEGRESKYVVEETLELFAAPKAKILVVDDNAVNLKVAGSMLSMYGIQTSFASSGMECLRLLEEGNFYDIIFMDHMMPQMDGVETTRLIRESEVHEDNREVIIALTANAIKGVEKMFFENGMDDYISKPLEFVRLDRILRKWLDPEKIEGISKETKTQDQDIETEEKELEKEDNGMELKHYNIEEGIDAVGGLAEVYYDILDVVVEEGEEKLKLIRELYDAKDYKNYEIEVHALKSAMAGVCVKDLSAMAKEHEFAVKEDRLSYVDEHVEELLELYSEVLEETKKILANVQ